MTPSDHDRRGSPVHRDVAIDYLRGGIVVLVVAHHSALAYTTFSHFNSAHYTASTAPVVDLRRWAPLDYLVAWNDIYFMALLFFISGLFVTAALRRKGARGFFRGRAQRLGIPFAVAVTLLMPIAYYPSWRMSDDSQRSDYLQRFFTSDGWPVGPPWFLWLLLVFCAVAALAYRFIPGLWPMLAGQHASGWRLAVVFLATSLAASVPIRLAVPPYSWSTLGGPFDFQTSRLLLFFAYFSLGVSLGGDNLNRTLYADNLRPWPLWLALGLASFVVHWTLSGGAILRSAPLWVKSAALAAVFSLCCSFTALGALGISRLLFRGPWWLAESLSANSYGIYVLHYGFVTWIQFALLLQSWPAALKFAVTFLLALIASWTATAALRRTAVGRFL